VIRFSAFLVVAAVGTLIAGVVTSKLLLVYIAIGVSGLALLALGAGAVVHWRELTGKPETAAAGTGAQAPSPPPAVVPPPVTVPEPAAAQVASAAAGTAPAWSGAIPAGSSRSGYPPPAARPPAPSEWRWRDDPAPREAAADKPAASFTARGDSGPAVAADPPSVPDDDLPVQDQTMIFRQPDQTMIFRVQPSAEPEPSPAEPALAADAPAADAPVADVTAAEDTAAAADTDEVDTDAADTDAADTDAESATPVSAAEPAADTPADSALATSSKPATEPAVDTAPADDIAPADEPAPAADEPEPADDITTITKAAAPSSDAAPASGAAPSSDLEVTVVPGVPRYHRATCILIRFMGDSDLDKVTVAAAKEAGCTPCRACLPDQPEGSPELPDAAEPEPQA
jgi:hypothetical protein